MVSFHLLSQSSLFLVLLLYRCSTRPLWDLLGPCDHNKMSRGFWPTIPKTPLLSKTYEASKFIYVPVTTTTHKKTYFNLDSAVSIWSISLTKMTPMQHKRRQPSMRSWTVSLRSLSYNSSNTSVDMCNIVHHTGIVKQTDISFIQSPLLHQWLKII